MAPLVPLDTAEAESDEPSASSDDDHEDVFVNHGGAEHEHEEDDDLPETKSEAAAAALDDYQGDADVATAQAAEENEGEIEPVTIHNQIVEGEIIPLAEAQPQDGAPLKATLPKPRTPRRCRLSARRSAGCARSTTRFRKSSSAARSSWCRSSRKNAATRARR